MNTRLAEKITETMTAREAAAKRIKDPIITVSLHHVKDMSETLKTCIKYVLIYEQEGKQLLHRNGEVPALRADSNTVVWLLDDAEVTVLKGELRFCL